MVETRIKLYDLEVIYCVWNKLIEGKDVLIS